MDFHRAKKKHNFPSEFPWNPMCPSFYPSFPIFFPILFPSSHEFYLTKSSNKIP
jgi:hypothetical protein